MASETPDVKKRIVFIAMDGSKHSEYAFQWYADNLHRKHDEVVMAHCPETFHLQPTDLLGANETSMEELYHSTSEKSKAVYRHIDQLATKHKIAHRVLKLQGYPGHSLVKAAEERKANLIICGSRGQGAVRRTIMGSISDYILHHAHMPVVICKHEDELKKLKH